MDQRAHAKGRKRAHRPLDRGAEIICGCAVEIVFKLLYLDHVFKVFFVCSRRDHANKRRVGEQGGRR